MSKRAATMLRCVAVMALCCGAALVPAQVAPAAANAPTEAAPAEAARGSDVVAGRVVDGVTGRGVAGARVFLQPVRADDKPPGPRQDMETGADGEFRFQALPAGKFNLSATAEGHVGAAYQEHDGFSTAVVTGKGLKTTGLLLRLQPSGRITGRVVDEAGEPAPQIELSLYMVTQTGEGPRVRPAGTTNTDDLGRYEFVRLRPGTYYLASQGMPWYQTVRPSLRPGQERPLEGNFDASLDAVYPLMFYPGSSREDGAAPIEIRPGKAQRINIALTPAPAAHVQLPSGSAGGSLRRQVFGNWTSVRTGPAMGNGDGTMEMTGVPPGDFEVQRFAQGRGMVSAGQVHAGAEGTSSFTPAAEDGGATLVLNVRDTFGSPLPKGSVLRLFPPELDQPSPQIPPNARVDENGQAKFTGVPAGSWRVQVTAGRRVAFPLEMKTEAGEVQPPHITLKPGETLTAELTVATNACTLTGFVHREHAEESGNSMVVLVPLPATDSRAGSGSGSAAQQATLGEVFRRDQSDLDGSFVLRNVLPGHYAVVAIDEGWALDWRRFEVMRPYLKQAVEVTVEPNTVRLEVNKPVPTQPR